MSQSKEVDIEQLADLCTPWCIHVIATLRIAEHVAAGLHGIDELASASGSHPESLRRVLRHVVSRGLFEETAPGQFGFNDAARALLEPAARLGLDLDAIGGRMALAWGSLLRAVRTGAPAYHEVFGRPFWDDLAAHPDVAESFDALMGPAGHGPPNPDVLVGTDWDGVHRIVDVGGGTGALLAAILTARPDTTGTLVELPSTAARALVAFEAGGLAHRVTIAAQSFFDQLPSGGDLYILKNVLADWPDCEAISLLTRCAEAASPGGRIVVAGGVSEDDRCGPPPELLMMVLVGGKNRTLSEFRALAGAANLAVTRSGHQRSGRFVVECRPVPIAH